jgi:hypothetical protein
MEIVKYLEKFLVGNSIWISYHTVTKLNHSNHTKFASFWLNLHDKTTTKSKEFIDFRLSDAVMNRFGIALFIQFPLIIVAINLTSPQKEPKNFALTIHVH